MRVGAGGITRSWPEPQQNGNPYEQERHITLHRDKSFLDFGDWLVGVRLLILTLMWPTHFLWLKYSVAECPTICGGSGFGPESRL